MTSVNVVRATHYVNEAHKGQFRKNGTTPFITHPLEVAEIVKTQYSAGVGMNSAASDRLVIAALAHDCVEDVDEFDLDEFLDNVYNGDKAL